MFEVAKSFPCSAGIGRSGTFCLVDCCLVLIDREGESRVSVQDVLLELRKYRMGLIQTHDQLTFSYEAIIEGMKRMNNDVSFFFDDVERLVKNKTFYRLSTNWIIWRLQPQATTMMKTRHHHYHREHLHVLFKIVHYQFPHPTQAAVT